MRKPLAGIDIDDTILDSCTAMLKWHNRIYGTSHTRNDNRSFELGKLLRCSEEEAARRYYNFYHSSDHQHLLLVDAALHNLTQLAQTHELVAITARPRSVHRLTVNIVERLVPSIFSNYYFLGHHHDEGGPQISKGELCAALSVSFAVDDALHNAHSIGEKGIPVYLLDAPWNQGKLPLNTTRVFGWGDILSQIA